MPTDKRPRYLRDLRWRRDSRAHRAVLSMQDPRARRTLPHFPASGPWRERRAPEVQSCCVSVNSQTLDPNRETNGGDRVSRAESGKQFVVPAASDEWVASALRISQ